MISDLWGDKDFKYECTGAVRISGQTDVMSINNIAERDIIHRAEHQLISGLSNEIANDLKPAFIKKHAKEIEKLVREKMERQSSPIIEKIAQNAVDIALEEDEEDY